VFQKRGLPHAHIIVWLKRDEHFSPEELDEIICAEIPDEEVTIKVMKEVNGQEVESEERIKNPLHDAVKMFMLHGLCGPDNPTLSCMRDGFCRYGYRKDYLSHTEMSEDGYPLYRRRSPEEEGNVCEK